MGLGAGGARIERPDRVEGILSLLIERSGDLQEFQDLLL